MLASKIAPVTYGDLLKIAEASPGHHTRAKRATKLVGIARDWAHVNGALVAASEERIEQFDRLLDWVEEDFDPEIKTG